MNEKDVILLKHWVVDNHPVSGLPLEKRKVYLKGLGMALYAIWGDDTNLITFFGLWSRSILDNDYVGRDSFRAGSISDIKHAVRIENKWWQFLRLRDTFFFDLMYLATYDGDYTRARKTAEFFYQGFDQHIKRHARMFSGFPECLTNGLPVTVSSSQKALLEENKEIDFKSFFKVLLVANVSAGKSTLINALTGKRFCRSSNLPCTNKVHYVFNRRRGQSAIFRKGGQFEEFVLSGFLDFDSISLPFHSSWDGVPICFIDSPGMNNSENSDHARLAYSFIKKGEYDLLMYVSNAQYFDTIDERKALKAIKVLNRERVLFVLNQLDSFDPETDSISSMITSFQSVLKQVGFKDPMIIPVSGYTSLLNSISNEELGLKDRINKRYLSSVFREEFYDLPSYVGIISPDKTGVELLEQTIKSMISK